jgi:hypothetical protein
MYREDLYIHRIIYFHLLFRNILIHNIIRELGLENYSRNYVRWFEHVERRLVDSVIRGVDHMERSQITRSRGRPRKTVKKKSKD